MHGSFAHIGIKPVFKITGTNLQYKVKLSTEAKQSEAQAVFESKIVRVSVWDHPQQQKMSHKCRKKSIRMNHSQKTKTLCAPG